MSLTVMATIGEPGVMFAACASGDNEREIRVGAATPANSPSGGGKRRIPDRECVERFMLVPEGERSNFNSALREVWQTSQSIRRENGRSLAHINPYFHVLRPSRFFDPSLADGVGRPIDVCYEVGASGVRVRGSNNECDRATSNGAVQGLAHDHPSSVFNGVSRFVDINSNRITNADGPEVWYTNPFGNSARSEPFAGSIRQYIARIDNTERNPHGPNIGRDRDYGGPGVRAPN